MNAYLGMKKYLFRPNLVLLFLCSNNMFLRMGHGRSPHWQENKALSENTYLITACETAFILPTRRGKWRPSKAMRDFLNWWGLFCKGSTEEGGSLWTISESWNRSRGGDNRRWICLSKTFFHETTLPIILWSFLISTSPSLRIFQVTISCSLTCLLLDYLIY